MRVSYESLSKWTCSPLTRMRLGLIWCPWVEYSVSKGTLWSFMYIWRRGKQLQARVESKERIRSIHGLLLSLRSMLSLMACATLSTSMRIRAWLYYGTLFSWVLVLSWSWPRYPSNSTWPKNSFLSFMMNSKTVVSHPKSTISYYTHKTRIRTITQNNRFKN